MTQLSVVMITKNAERLLDIVLKKAIQIADELVIVDSGSTDQTLEIAKKYTSNIVQQPWLGFGLQKQKAVDLATKDWILVLDADEVLTDGLISTLNRWKAHASEASFSAYEIKRPLVFGEKILKRCIPLWVVRLFKKGCGQFTEQTVHERLIITGSIGRIQSGELLHYSYASVGDWLNRMHRYIDLSVQEKQRSPRRKVTVGFAVLSGIFTFLKMYLFKGGFLEGRMGLVFTLNWGISNYLKYLKLAIDKDFKVVE